VSERLTIRRFLADESGATAIEYGLICAMIAVVVISIAGVGGGLTVTYNKLNAVIEALGGGGGNDP
jgi:pilus assembly protein Flp/PilA